jgi:hypothetical protein
MTTWATCTPRGPNSRANVCEMERPVGEEKQWQLATGQHVRQGHQQRVHAAILTAAHDDGAGHGHGCGRDAHAERQRRERGHERHDTLGRRECPGFEADSWQEEASQRQHQRELRQCPTEQPGCGARKPISVCVDGSQTIMGDRTAAHSRGDFRIGTVRRERIQRLGQAHVRTRPPGSIALERDLLSADEPAHDREPLTAIAASLLQSSLVCNNRLCMFSADAAKMETWG